MLARPMRLWSFGPLLLLACVEPPDISGQIETYANQRSAANTLLCGCPQLLGFADSIQCDEALGPVGRAARQCMATVLDGHEDAAVEYLGCANAAYQNYIDCLETNASCEHSVFDDCTADHEAVVPGCPRLPTDVQSAFDACVM